VISLRPYQTDISDRITQAWSGGAQNVCAVLPTGAGKCLGENTPVLMFDGQIKKVQDIKAGELLIGPDSKPRVVLSTCSGSENLYKITPIKGDSYIVNESHILSLKQTGLKSKPKYPCQYGKGDIKNISVHDYLKKSNNFKHTHKGWRSGIKWSGEIIDEYLPAYLLGVWLGDGSSRHAAITTMDPEIENYIIDFTWSRDLPLRIERNGENNKSKNYHILSNGRQSDSVNSSLRENDLILNKHIPLKYKTSSENDRLELLAGIIDTDGALSRGGYDIIFKNKRLANDTAFISRSLGFAAYVKKCKKTCTNNGVTGDYYRISITGNCDKIPVKISRKKAPERKQKKSVLVTGITVEKIGHGKYYGFEIDKDGLFLLGDFTVTHNTIVFGNKLAGEYGTTFAIAHRQELIGQISMALAKYGIPHVLHAPKKVVQWIVSLQTRTFGRHFVNGPGASCHVAGVITLLNRANSLSSEIRRSSLWVIDEFHHCLKDNVWGKAVKLFPESCRGLGVTATPERADGKGIGRHASGFADTMVVGPGMRCLIQSGYLTDYRIFGPYSDIDLSGVTIGSTGDYSKPKLVAAVRKSRIVGDVVRSYCEIAPGKIGVTFVPDVKTAEELATAYTAAGVPARIVHAKTPDRQRQESTEMLARGELKQLVNVDIFGEGYDLPAIETISMARPTESYPLYVQQFGRGLRILEGKTDAIIIDHVRNVTRHGLPDSHREWSLDNRERKSSKRDPDLVPIRTCRRCTAVYESWQKDCPYCGWVYEAAPMGTIEQVEGDITELDPSLLAVMRGEVDRIDEPDYMMIDRLRKAGMPPQAVNGAAARHRERQEAQCTLRSVIAEWAGYQNAAGQHNGTVLKRFYHSFGMDILSAQALGRRQAEELTERLRGVIQ